MGFKFKMTVPLPKEIYNEARRNRNLILESYIDDEGNMVISSLDEDDLNSYACDNDCGNCPLYDNWECKCIKPNKFDIEECLKRKDCCECSYQCGTCGTCSFDE